MMESLRNFLTGPRLFVVIAACALPFVFLGTSSLGSTFQNSFGSVNGEDITQADLQVATNMTVQKFKNVYGDDFDFNELDESIQLEAVKQELISQKVLLSESRSFGLVNSDTERQAKKSIIRNPVFQIDGVFDEGVYEAQVNSAGYTKDSYIEMTKDMMASEMFRIALGSSRFTTEVEVKELAQILEQSVDIDFIKLDSNQLKSQIVNSADELKEYYENNQIMFFSDESRSFDYFLLVADDYKEQVQVPEGYIDNAYADYLSRASGRDEIRFSHIMIEKANHSSDEIAFDVISDVYSKLKNGDNFSDIALAYSDDVVTKDSGGDLEYFDADVFPQEFANALKDLDVEDLSEIVELEDTLHILKVTELNTSEVMSLSEMENILIEELVDSESIALMSDDFNQVDEMIFANESINSIASSLSKNIIKEENKKISTFNFDINDTRIKDFIFSPDSQIGAPSVIDLGDSIIVLSISNIKEPSIQAYDDVKGLVEDYLSDSKAIEKQSLLTVELDLAKKGNTIDSFIEAYNFISKESFVAVKRYSSLLPQEVISEVFKTAPDNSITINARNGDIYMVDLLSINQPTIETIDELYEQYNNFTEERVSRNISSLINEEIIDSARVNLDNLAF